MMGGRGEMKSLSFKKSGILSDSHLGLQWSNQDCTLYPGGGLFASVQMGDNGNGGLKLPYADLLVKYVSLPEGFKNLGEDKGLGEKKKKRGLKLKIKIPNPSLRRLVSGGIAGAVSRTVVAPLETIRTHLMVGSSGHSTTEVFNNIMKTEGWKGLFRGNFVNVIRVAPSKAIEVSGVLGCCLSYVDCLSLIPIFVYCYCCYVFCFGLDVVHFCGFKLFMVYC